MRRPFAPIAASAGLLTLALAAPARADSIDSFAFSGDCTGGSVAITTDKANVDPFVDDRFKVAADPVTSQVPLIVQAFQCNPWEQAPLAPSFPARNHIVTEIFVAATQTPGGALVSYDLPAVGTSSELQAKWGRFGLANHLAPDLTYAGLGAEVDASVPEHSNREYVTGYTLSVRGNGNPLPDLNDGSESCVWQVGNRGPVCTRFPLLENPTLDFGTGTITATPGSTMAQLLGRRSVTGVAAVRDFLFTATSELVPDGP